MLQALQTVANHFSVGEQFTIVRETAIRYIVEHEDGRYFSVNKSDIGTYFKVVK